MTAAVPGAARAPVALREVRKRFGRWSPWVLDGVDLLAEPGSTTFVVGANGSGKSTMLRILAGLTRPSAGRVEGDRGSIGYAPDRLGARARMTAGVYAEHMGRLRGYAPEVARERSQELFARLGLLPGPDAPIRSLSRGNSQKVALTQALLAPVGLLLLDEPYSGLDAPARASLADLLAERAATGAAVVITAHQPPGVSIGTRTLHLVRGRLTSTEPARAAATRIRLASVSPGAALAALQSLAGVVRAQGDDAAATVFVDPTHGDDVLRFALGHGWSVTSVGAAVEDDGQGGS